jgi:hypothetical protein
MNILLGMEPLGRIAHAGLSTSGTNRTLDFYSPIITAAYTESVSSEVQHG